MPGNREIFAAAMNQADSLRWDRQWGEAASQYQRALEEFPADTSARRGMAHCYMQTRQWEAALAEYQRVLERDAANVIALAKVAELYVILQRDKEAFQGYLVLGDYYAEDAQSGRAEAAWQKATQLSFVEPGPHERLGKHFSSKHDYTSAVREYLAAAQGYVHQGDFAQARQQCEAALQINPEHEQAQKLLAHLVESLSGSSTAKGMVREGLAAYSILTLPEFSEGGVPL